MICSHNINKTSEYIYGIDYNEYNESILGRLLIDYTYGDIYSTSNRYKKYILGSGFRNLNDFPEYLEGSISTKVNYSLLRYRFIDNIGYFTNEYPELRIIDIVGSIITSYIKDSYIEVNNDSKLFNSNILNFKIFDLGDVKYTAESAFYNDSNNKFVLSSRYVISNPNSNKDYFNNSYAYLWELKPEMSKFSALDDVDYKNALEVSEDNSNLDLINNWIYRTKEEGENNISGSLYADKLSIVWDINPSLNNYLDVNNFSIYNQTYTTNTYILTKSIETIVLDCDKYDIFVLNCTALVGLINCNIEFNLNIFSDNLNNYIADRLKQISVYTIGLNGLIEYYYGGVAANINYEQGLFPEILFSNFDKDLVRYNLYSLYLYFENSQVKINLLHKNQNLVNSYKGIYLE